MSEPSPSRIRLYTAASQRLQAKYSAERKAHRKRYKLPGKLGRYAKPAPGASGLADEEDG